MHIAQTAAMTMWTVRMISRGPAAWLTMATLPIMRACSCISRLRTACKPGPPKEYIPLHRHDIQWKNYNFDFSQKRKPNAHQLLWESDKTMRDKHQKFFLMNLGNFFLCETISFWFLWIYYIKDKGWTVESKLCTLFKVLGVNDTERAAAYKPRHNLHSSDQSTHLVLFG